ncbi:hypothetical protein HU200_031332 [Digitaria exilis]|uniref:Wall-associated receptor kinase galacturonan-binding domain-containing protein n=1 Tax=Digitaria exilis TaxID=1010633 RepID=A0A835BQZ3_9POAL|nr:hypothetical protein HU200_031332 [Digitaria exilis]
MQPAVLLLLLLLPLSSSLLLCLATSAAADTYGSCAPATCGNLNISYPFSLGGKQPLHCGFPAFALICDDRSGHAYLNRTFRENLYRVDNISYANRSLVVAVETAFAGDATCPIPDFNVSAGLLPLPGQHQRHEQEPGLRVQLPGSPERTTATSMC